MSTDPRRLVPVLDQMDLTMGDWTRSVVAAAEDGGAICRSVDNAFRVLHAHLRQQRDLVDQSRLEAQGVMHDAERATREAEAALVDARRAESGAAAASTRAAQEESSWRSKRSEAETERSAAQTEVNLAKTELAAAESERQHAQMEESHASDALYHGQARMSSAGVEVSAAASALANCQNSYATDSQGRRVTPDCSSPAHRLQSAKVAYEHAKAERDRCAQRLELAKLAVSKATARVAAAQSWVMRAQARLQRAERRVAVCHDRVARLGQLRTVASRLADEGAAAARMALTASAVATDAMASADRLSELVTLTESHVGAAEVSGEAIRQQAQALTLRTTSFAHVAGRQSDARAAANHELTNAREELWIFDSPAELH